MRLPFWNAKSRLKRAFVACDAGKAAGLGWKMKTDGELANLFNRMAEAELALGGARASETGLSSLELELLGSYDSLNRFFSEPPSAGRLWKQVESAVPRFAVAVAAVAVLVLLSPGSSIRDNSGMLERGSAAASFVRPYCVPPQGQRGAAEVRDALFTGQDAECFQDEHLVLGYRLGQGRGAGWFHAYAVPEGETEPIWIVPNPMVTSPVLLQQPGGGVGQAWHPIKLSVNYKPGTYQIYWFICDTPRPFDWMSEECSQNAPPVDRLPLPARGCDRGAFTLFVEEVQE
jgi:hypothetical protein